ncbi:hypothetical protein N180_17815 [Pedobacter antarcticus 4BY]|uniref:Uncharacterized protein n=1 Tax=Pedobacter antarcticus 4BY TaxID=1358423 RepID=A0A081PHT4_9SPHI|nr:hypothetical protein N180_17815 [Pedobacter antarcticus 4BY]
MLMLIHRQSTANKESNLFMSSEFKSINLTSIQFTQRFHQITVNIYIFLIITKLTDRKLYQTG